MYPGLGGAFVYLQRQGRSIDCNIDPELAVKSVD